MWLHQYHRRFSRLISVGDSTEDPLLHRSAKAEPRGHSRCYHTAPSGSMRTAKKITQGVICSRGQWWHETTVISNCDPKSGKPQGSSVESEEDSSHSVVLLPCWRLPLIPIFCSHQCWFSNQQVSAVGRLLLIYSSACPSYLLNKDFPHHTNHQHQLSLTSRESSCTRCIIEAISFNRTFCTDRRHVEKGHTLKE